METVVCQITRGLAPARSIADACMFARRYKCEYFLIHGFDAASAKNQAAEIALEHGADLILCEDDIYDPHYNVLHSAYMCDCIGYADATCQNGQPNTVFNDSGQFLYSGNIILKIPHTHLTNLPRPLFQARQVVIKDGRLKALGDMPNKSHSDVYFWYLVQEYLQGVPVRCLGKVGHILHPFQRGHDNTVKMEIV